MTKKNGEKSLSERVLTKEEMDLLLKDAPGRKARILVVDDDKMFREMLVNVLSLSAKYFVEEAANGIEATVRLGTHRPDLLVLDIFMPEMDGLELCRIIKNDPELACLQVIVITGFPEHPNVKQLSEMGFTNIFNKPFELSLFIQTVDRLLKAPD